MHKSSVSTLVGLPLAKRPKIWYAIATKEKRSYRSVRVQSLNVLLYRLYSDRFGTLRNRRLPHLEGFEEFIFGRRRSPRCDLGNKPQKERYKKDVRYQKLHEMTLDCVKRKRGQGSFRVLGRVSIVRRRQGAFFVV